MRTLHVGVHVCGLVAMAVAVVVDVAHEPVSLAGGVRASKRSTPTFTHHGVRTPPLVLHCVVSCSKVLPSVPIPLALPQETAAVSWHSFLYRPPPPPPPPPPPHAQSTEYNTCVFKLEVSNPSDPADVPNPMQKGTSYAAGPRRTMNVFRYTRIKPKEYSMPFHCFGVGALEA